MRKIAYIKYRLNLSGLYFWGKGWRSQEVAARWEQMCTELKTGNIFCFRESILVPSDFGRSAQFFSDKFSAYMHPMEVTGYYRTSEYCPGEELRAMEDLKDYMKYLLQVIRQTFSDIDISASLDAQSYIIDLDEPTVKVYESMD